MVYSPKWANSTQGFNPDRCIHIGPGLSGCEAISKMLPVGKPGHRLEAYASAPLRCRSPQVKVLHCLTVKEQEARRKGVAARRGLRHRSAR